MNGINILNNIFTIDGEHDYKTGLRSRLLGDFIPRQERECETVLPKTFQEITSKLPAHQKPVLGFPGTKTNGSC